MSIKGTKKLNVYALCQCGILVALATILSFLPIFERPMGGSVTLASMLPILLIGVKLGYKWGLGASCVYMFIQVLQALIKGNVFVYCVGAVSVIICLAFDYIFPFTLLGLSAFAKPKKNNKLSVAKVCVTFGALITLRFICHFITGVVIWGQWAPEGTGKFIYSLVYNGQYMLFELIITVTVAALMLSSKQIVKILTEN